MAKQISNEKKATGTADSNITGYGVKRKGRANQKRKTSDTFWNLLRIKNNMKLEDLSDVTGYKIYSISNWFIGKNMPNDGEIKVFCDWFGVPFEKGKLEFQNGYTIYHGGHGTITKEPRKATQGTLEDVSEYAENKEIESVEERHKALEEEARKLYFDDVKDANKEAVVSMLFYELSYEEWRRLDNEYDSTDPMAILRGLYQKASFETFMHVAQLLHAF